MMASKQCVSCHDLDFQDLGNSKRGTEEEGPSITISLLDIQPNCTYCSLLQRMVLHFAPRIEQSYKKPTLHLSLEANCAMLGEIMGISLKGDQSITSIDKVNRAVLGEIMGLSPKDAQFTTSIDRFHFYLQGKVGRFRLMFPLRHRS